MSIHNPSIGYLITSVGRDTLKDTLRSLYGQFAHGLDRIYLYFDGRCELGIDHFSEEFEMYGNDIQWKLLPENLGYWGHGIRNTYQTECETDYVHNMDDDDIYVEGTIPIARSAIQKAYGKVLICKFRNGGTVIWRKQKISFGDIGTPSGFIPNRREVFGTWGYGYGGDYDFYTSLQERIGKENLVFNGTLIVKTRPRIYGY